MENKFKLSLIFTIAAFVLCVFGASAQITTSALDGLVTDDANEPIIGCTVYAEHTPSGTRYGAATNMDGRYSIQGMKAGGPYTVTFSYLGMQTYVVKDVTLSLAETYTLNAKLAPASTQLQEVVVSAQGSKFSNERTGAATNISQSQMSAMPTINRSLTDMAKLSPYANGMSFAGGDGRSSNFTVDGANFNNNFGLTEKLPGGGNPISIDAIQEMQVVVAPFDVRQSNFIGGGVNAVTKSGTNKFNGTAYGYFTNQDMRGNKIDGIDLGERSPESRTTYGFTLGGPIVKNKLFFFVNYENEKSPKEVIKYRARQEDETATPGGMISRTLASDMQKVYDHLKNNYGYDAGSFTKFPGDASTYRFLARLDWNISDAHRLSLRYNTTKASYWIGPSGKSSDVQPALTKNRVSEYGMAFANSMYSSDNKVNTWAAELNSRFSNKVANQALFTYSLIEDVRGSNSDPFPFIDIMAGLNPATGKQIYEPYISAGYELFTYNNGVTNKSVTFTDNATIFLGKHKVTTGVNIEHQFADNAYMRGATGYYRFSSIDDFLGGKAPEAFTLTYGAGGNKKPSAKVTFNQYSFYAQDEWNLTRDFMLTYGSRFDLLAFDNADIMTNTAILDYNFNGAHIDTGLWPKNRLQVSPRVGFSWDVRGDKTLKLRGGSGLFAGRLPLVFFTNMPSNASLYQITTGFGMTAQDKNNPNLEKLVVDGKIMTDMNEVIAKFGFPNSVEKHTATTKMSGVEREFKMPQVWKSSIAADYKLPLSFPFTVTGEFIFNKNINAVIMKNINLKDPETEGWERFRGADNRLIYPDASKAYYNYIGKSNINAIMLGNTNKGWGYSANITLNARPTEHISLMASYTHTESKQLSGLTGNDPIQAWQNMVGIEGPNFLKLQRSEFVIPNRVIASATWDIPFKRGGRTYKTFISLFYSGMSAFGSSWLYANDMNGDGRVNDLMWIPKDDTQIKFTSEADREAFWKFVEQDSYLSSHKGQYAEAYAARAPWVNRFDLRFTEEFDVKVGNTKNALQISLDFLNFGNLLNSSWGVEKTNTACNSHMILNYAGKDENNIPTFSMGKDTEGNYYSKTYATYSSNTQTWKVQVGLKYFFKQL